MNIGILVSAAISFAIAWLGWNKLEKRAKKMAKRSESFSLLAPTINLLNEFRTMAEGSLDSFHEDTEAVNFRSSNHVVFRSRYRLSHRESKRLDNVDNEAANILIKKHSFDMKFHSKYRLLKSKLEQLNTRGIIIPVDGLLVDLRIAFTSEDIDSLLKYNKALTASDRIESELYIGFERAYTS